MLGYRFLIPNNKYKKFVKQFMSQDEINEIPSDSDDDETDYSGILHIKLKKWCEKIDKLYIANYITCIHEDNGML